MTQLADHHVARAAQSGQSPSADSPPWVQALRTAGAERFESIGFPSRKEEHWRFTDLAPITRTQFGAPPVDGQRNAGAAAAAEFSLGRDADCELVFVNGRFDRQLSKVNRLPQGVRVVSLAEAFHSDSQLLRKHLAQYATVTSNPFVALNTASLADGAFIHVQRRASLLQPLHLLFVSAGADEPTIVHPRVLCVVEEQGSLNLVESYVGASDRVYFNNAVTEIAVAAGAQVDHCKLQQESLQAYHVATVQAQLGTDASFVSHSASIGSRITRNDLNVIMSGERAQATLNGLVLIGDNQHVDNHTLLDHAAAHCPSHELYKHVLEGKASGVFKGKILVRPGSQKTDSKQTSKTLLLSDDAVMNSQPALEIYADDVKCTHGSSTGPVDEDQIFYLRSRGVGLEAAQHLLTYAFAADITRRIKIEPVRRRLENYMAARQGLPQDLRIAELGAHDEAARNL